MPRPTLVAFVALAVSSALSAATPSIPIAFEANIGQAAEEVLFAARTPAGTVWLTRTGIVASLPEGGVGMRWLGGSAEPTVEGIDRLPISASLWRLDSDDETVREIPSYARVRYRGVYPGVDLEVYVSGGKVEYDFIVRPGADPKRIRLAFDGGDLLESAAGSAGGPAFYGALGLVKHGRLFSYQTVGGRQHEVESAFARDDEGVYGFELGAYDRSAELVIDPTIVLQIALGGDGRGYSFGVDIDPHDMVMCGDLFFSNFPLPNGEKSTTPSDQQQSIVIATFHKGGDGGWNYDGALILTEANATLRCNGIQLDPNRATPDEGTLYFAGSRNGGPNSDMLLGRIDFTEENGAKQFGIPRTRTIGGAREDLTSGLDSYVDPSGSVRLILRGYTPGDFRIEGVDIPGVSGSSGYVGIFNDQFRSLAGTIFEGVEMRGCAYSGGYVGCVATAHARETPLGTRPPVGTRSSLIAQFDAATMELAGGMYFNRNAEYSSEDILASDDGGWYVSITNEDQDSVEIVKVGDQSAAIRPSQGTGEEIVFAGEQRIRGQLARTPNGDLYLVSNSVLVRGQPFTTYIRRIDPATGDVVDEADIPIAQSVAAAINASGELAVVGIARVGLEQINPVQPAVVGFDDMFAMITAPDFSATLVSGASFQLIPVVPLGIYQAFYTALPIEGVPVFELDRQRKLPKQLAGLEILFDGDPGAMLFASAGQAAVIAPASVAGKESVAVTIRFEGQALGGPVMPAAASYPQFFTGNQQGFGPIAALNQDFSVNGANNPATDGSVLQMYGTHFGLYDGGCLEDELSPADRLLNVGNPFTVSLDGRQQQIVFSGAAPGQVCALGQANVIVDRGPGAEPGTTETPIRADGFSETETTAWTAPAP